jgi:serine/threonine protein kinase
MTPLPPPDELAARLGRALAPAYELESEIGRGGMAVVYKARDARLKRNVAVKLLPPDLAFRSDIRTRFLREAETAARLSHPNIVPIYSVDERDGLVYFVMALVEGESVGDRLRRTGALPVADARRIFREVADALACAHAAGVVHRDIKPDNILLDRVSGRALVTDFGIARAASEEGGGSRLTATGAAIGTPAYMSPEQCVGDREIDGRSDLYSLGTVVYQMLAGDPPFIGNNTPAIMMKQVTEAPVPIRQRRGEVPHALERIIMRLLEKDPDRRFPDGAALVAALDGTPLAEPVAAAEPPGGVRERLPQRTDQTLSRADRHLSRHEKRAARDLERAESRPEKPLPVRLRHARNHLVSYVGTSVMMFGINAATSHAFWWCVFPIMGMGLGFAKEIGGLWADGVPFRAIVGGDRPPDMVAAGRGGAAGALALSPAGASLDGLHGAVLRQAMNDRRNIEDLLNRLTAAELERLPDVKATAVALFDRISALAVALERLDAQVDVQRGPALDERIAQIEQQPGIAADRERRLSLLRRQRGMLADLVRSRATLLEQYESAGLLLQNLALDLLKVRSSGLDSAMGGIASATQEARALSREIGYVLSAADELRDLEGRAEREQ